MVKRRNPRRLNHLTIAKLVRVLQTVPSSVQDVAEATGLHVGTARHFLLALHAERATHIVGWDADSLGRAVTAIYALGEGADVKKPAPRRNMAAWKRQYRARIKASKQQAAILEAVHA